MEESRLMDYRIAIPSYGRSESIKNKTLKTLDDLKVDRDRVLIVCANNEQKELYDASVGTNWRIEVAEIGLVNAREWYHRYFPTGTRIINSDDDIEALIIKDGNGVAPYEGTIDDLAEDGFSQCEAANAKLWGIYPVYNGMFMNDQTVVGLRFIVGAFFGSYAGDSVFTNRRGSNDDWETTLQSFTTHGQVVRLEYLGIRTKYLLDNTEGGISQELGGIQARLTRRETLIHQVCNRYPHLTRTYRKAGNILNIRLKNITYAKIPKESRSEFVNSMAKNKKVIHANN